MPLFVTVTATVRDSPRSTVVVAEIEYVAAYSAAETWAGSFSGSPPSEPNQATPSRTRSTVSVYAPGVLGVVMDAAIEVLALGGTSAVSGVRVPSHTTTAPVASVQW